MKDAKNAESPVSESEVTGLPWPTTWNGVYFFVIGSFVLWLGLLIALTDIST